jgi:hypothetical protein
MATGRTATCRDCHRLVMHLAVEIVWRSTPFSAVGRMMSEQEMTLTFRCPRELHRIAPPPVPAGLGLPEWFKAMPQHAFNHALARETDTVKRCPPFVDAMMSGFLIPLICDVKVENGEFSGDYDLPPRGSVGFVRSPIGFHDPSQVTGTPWTIEVPEGFSLLFTHPINRFDLPFTTITGMVDCDLYHDTWIHVPAYWHDTGFNGVLPKGTPVAQCFPIRRDKWSTCTAAFADEETQRAHDTTNAIYGERGLYRRHFRA